LRVQAWISGSKWGDGGRKQEVLTTPESQGLTQVTPLEVSKAVPLSREGQDSIGTQPHGSVHARGEVDTKERKSWIWNLGMKQQLEWSQYGKLACILRISCKMFTIYTVQMWLLLTSYRQEEQGYVQQVLKLQKG